MDLVTIFTACAFGFKSELFVPLGALDNCRASFGLGAAVAPRNGSAKIEQWAGYITEAARRFGRPEAWVRAVMQAESRGAADATSSAGAIGLMQIMPDTYAELRARYGLGANAYDPHDNILAGTAYMSEMIELFGVPNFLAAYNAGPARLEDHLHRGRPLPRETQQYLAQIGELPAAAPRPPDEAPAPQSLPFVAAASNAPKSSPQMTSVSAAARRMIGAPLDEPQHRRSKKIAARNELFAQRWSSPSATPALTTKPPSASDIGTGFALFIPLGCDPMRLSANTPSSHPE